MLYSSPLLTAPRTHARTPVHPHCISLCRNTLLLVFGWWWSLRYLVFVLLVDGSLKVCFTAAPVHVQIHLSVYVCADVFSRSTRLLFDHGLGMHARVCH